MLLRSYCVNNINTYKKSVKFIYVGTIINPIVLRRHIYHRKIFQKVFIGSSLNQAKLVQWLDIQKSNYVVMYMV